MSKPRILVTGGAGYLGSVVSHLLRERGYDILIADDFSSGHAHACGTIAFVRASVTDIAAMQTIFADFKPDAVVHLAALSNMEMCEADATHAELVNVAGTKNLLNLGVDKMVFASSAAVYAHKDSAIREIDRRAAESVYGKTKIAAEDAIAASGINAVALRFFNVAGADKKRALGECHEPETHLIPKLIDAVFSGREIAVYGRDYPTGDGTAARDYVHVLDAADAVEKALVYLLGGGASVTVNVGSGVARTVQEVVDAAAGIFGTPARIRNEARRTGDVAALCADITAISGIFAWTPAHSTLAEIIESAAYWHKQKDML